MGESKHVLKMDKIRENVLTLAFTSFSHHLVDKQLRFLGEDEFVDDSLTTRRFFWIELHCSLQDADRETTSARDENQSPTFPAILSKLHRVHDVMGLDAVNLMLVVVNDDLLCRQSDSHEFVSQHLHFNGSDGCYVSRKLESPLTDSLRRVRGQGLVHAPDDDVPVHENHPHWL